MSSIELGLVIDRYASGNAKRTTDSLIRRASSCIQLTAESVANIETARMLPRGILAVGGEATIRRIVQTMVDASEIRPIALLGGGTNNVLYHSLLEAGQAMPIAKFLWAVGNNCFPASFALRPGLIGRRAFVLHAGLGNFEQSVGWAIKNSRGLAPRKFRPLLSHSIGLALACLLKDDQLPPLDLYTISPRLGKRTLFPEQAHQGDSITHAWIETGTHQETRRKLIKTALYWRFGKHPDCVKLEQAASFKINSDINTLWLEGDNVPNQQKPPFSIRRWEHAIPVVAIDY